MQHLIRTSLQSFLSRYPQEKKLWTSWSGSRQTVRIWRQRIYIFSWSTSKGWASVTLMELLISYLARQSISQSLCISQVCLSATASHSLSQSVGQSVSPGQSIQSDSQNAIYSLVHFLCWSVVFFFSRSVCLSVFSVCLCQPASKVSYHPVILSICLPLFLSIYWSSSKPDCQIICQSISSTVCLSDSHLVFRLTY